LQVVDAYVEDAHDEGTFLEQLRLEKRTVARCARRCRPDDDLPPIALRHRDTNGHPIGSRLARRDAAANRAGRVQRHRSPGGAHERTDNAGTDAAKFRDDVVGESRGGIRERIPASGNLRRTRRVGLNRSGNGPTGNHITGNSRSGNELHLRPKFGRRVRNGCDHATGLRRRAGFVGCSPVELRVGRISVARVGHGPIIGDRSIGSDASAIASPVRVTTVDGGRASDNRFAVVIHRAAITSRRFRDADHVGRGDRHSSQWSANGDARWRLHPAGHAGITDRCRHPA
jgi:hypothetical protein